MKHYKERGLTKIIFKSAICNVALDASEYDRLKQCWQAGNTFFDGINLYGGLISIKLADVVAVQLSTPESIAAEEEDDKADALQG